ncbi:MAG: hypothetical protein HC828_12150 [Blastochloris sp.]|nr:hypothetical protein [Blastochloris sp.]
MPEGELDDSVKLGAGACVAYRLSIALPSMVLDACQRTPSVSTTAGALRRTSASSWGCRCRYE